MSANTFTVTVTENRSYVDPKAGVLMKGVKIGGEEGTFVVFANHDDNDKSKGLSMTEAQALVLLDMLYHALADRRMTTRDPRE